MIKVAFFDAKAYDKPSFEQYGSLHNIHFKYLLMVFMIHQKIMIIP